VSLIEKIIAVVAILAALYAVHYAVVKKAVHEEHEAVVKTYEDQVAVAQAGKLAAESQLVLQKTQADLEKQNEIKNLDTQYSTLVSSLRQRATRAEASKAGSGAIASTNGSCTGAQLYRDDAEFLAGYAQQAEGVRIERDYYYGRYEAARKLLSGQESDAGLDGSVSDSKSVP
jgi:small-conductance mechanosensitive channel